MPAPTTYEIGANLAGVATLASQDCINPESTFIDFQETSKLESGITRGLGLPRATWRWGYLYKEQYDALRTYCVGVPSAAVCIATLNNDMEYVRYNCNMEMPIQYAIRSPEGRQVYMDVTVEFTELVEAE